MGLVGITIFDSDIGKLLELLLLQLYQGGVKLTDPCKKLGGDAYMIDKLSFKGPFGYVELSSDVL